MDARSAWPLATAGFTCGCASSVDTSGVAIHRKTSTRRSTITGRNILSFAPSSRASAGSIATSTRRRQKCKSVVPARSQQLDGTREHRVIVNARALRLHCIAGGDVAQRDLTIVAANSGVGVGLHDDIAAAAMDRNLIGSNGRHNSVDVGLLPLLLRALGVDRHRGVDASADRGLHFHPIAD